MANSTGKAFGIMFLFVFIAILAKIIGDAVADPGNLTGAALLLYNLLPFAFVAIGLLLALKEGGLIDGN